MFSGKQRRKYLWSQVCTLLSQSGKQANVEAYNNPSQPRPLFPFDLTRKGPTNPPSC
jgi:hypothetical protein